MTPTGREVECLSICQLVVMPSPYLSGTSFQEEARTLSCRATCATGSAETFATSRISVWTLPGNVQDRAFTKNFESEDEIVWRNYKIVIGLENNGCGVQEQILVLYLFFFLRLSDGVLLLMPAGATFEHKTNNKPVTKSFIWSRCEQLDYQDTVKWPMPPGVQVLLWSSCCFGSEKVDLVRTLQLHCRYRSNSGICMRDRSRLC